MLSIINFTFILFLEIYFELISFLFLKATQKIAELQTNDKDKKEVTQKLSRWRKNDETANKQVKYIFKSIDEVIEQGNDKPSFTDAG